MQTPLKFDFNKLPRQQSLETFARDQARSLERYCNNIIGCHVTLELAQGLNNTGRKYQASVRMTVPGKELVSSRRADDEGHSDPKVVIRDAFTSVRRQLQEYLVAQASPQAA